MKETLFLILLFYKQGLLFASVFCGLIMVLGGMILLYKGVIKLDQTLGENQDLEALKIEFQDQLKFSTKYPALGLFGIGLIFTLVPVIYDPGLPPINIKAKTNAGQESIRSMQVSPVGKALQWVKGGNLIATLSPQEMDILKLEIKAIGYDPEEKSTSQRLSELNITSDGSFDFGEINFPTQIASPPVTTDIDEVENVPSVGNAGAFGTPIN